MAFYPKSPQDIEAMRVANQLAAATLDMITPFVQPGVTTLELDTRCHDFMRDHQAEPAPLIEGFPKATCTSANHVICHGIPNDRPLKSGDILNIDISLKKNGFCGDTSKMFFVGKPSILARRLVTTTQQCLYAAIACVRPGAHLGDIGHAIQTLAESNGFSVVREYCGHGIGRTLHEDPQVMHYGLPGTGLRLEPGMTFTIEPMINAGTRHIRQLNDGWTVVTRDRSLSAQWEHTLLVTETGHDVLSRRDEEAEL